MKNFFNIIEVVSQTYRNESESLVSISGEDKSENEEHQNNSIIASSIHSNTQIILNGVIM